VSGRPDLVAKLYHAPAEEHARKLRVMLAHPPAADDGAPSLVWPADLLHDPAGRTVGILMPRVSGMQRAFELYNPATRRTKSPHFDYARLHRTARNVAAAFDALHAAGYVVGDANESNVLVDDAGNVTVIDTDSFQVRDPATGDVFRCPVGRPEFAPPELQGKTLSEMDRTPEHDRFALGVLVFQLLMEGTHPFAGQWEGPADPPDIPQRIARGMFPYTPGAELKPPRNAPPIDILHPLVRGAVRRCFEVGHLSPSARPEPREWMVALDAARAALVTCASNPVHVYGGHLGACPWCERARALGGRDPFPSREAVARGDHLKPPERRRVARAKAEVPATPKLRRTMRGLTQQTRLGAQVEQFVGGAGWVLVVAALVHALPGGLAFVALLGGASRVRKVMNRSNATMAGVVTAGALLLLYWFTTFFATLGAVAVPAAPVAGVPVVSTPAEPPFVTTPPLAVEPLEESQALVFEPTFEQPPPALAHPLELVNALRHLVVTRETQVGFIITPDGHVEPASLDVDDAHAGGVDEARAALALPRPFTPGVRAGQPVRTHVTVTVAPGRNGTTVALQHGTWNVKPQDTAHRTSVREDLLVVRGPDDFGSRAVEVPPVLLNEAAIGMVLRTMSVPERDGTEAERTMAMVRMHVMTNGSVERTSVRVLRAGAFDQVAVQAARTMKFSPAIDGGRPVDAWIVVDVHYPRPVR
jgi:TonB family protein